jgi:hypothetical protein
MKFQNIHTVSSGKRSKKCAFQCSQQDTSRRRMKMLVKRRSPSTGEINERNIDITVEQLREWQHGGKLIQDAMPNISDDDREFLKTGYTREDWNKVFPPECLLDALMGANKSSEEVARAEIPLLNRRQRLEIYLQWNGIHGFTDDILEVINSCPR